MNDDELLDAVAEAIDGVRLSREYDGLYDLARAALAVARPAIRDEVLGEVLQVLRVEWAALYALSKRIGGYDLNGAMRARDAADAVSVVVGKVEDLLDSKGDEPRELPIHRTEAGYPNCSTCDGGGCYDCTDPA